jgi:hypothetical protein
MDKLDALQFAAEEADYRAVRFKDVEVIPFDTYRGSAMPLCPPGSITLFFTRSTEDIVERIRSAASNGSNVAHDELSQEVQANFDGRDPINYSRAWRLLKRSPVFADVRCGSKTLATNLFLPEDMSIGRISFPYNGGTLPADTFTLVEHVDDNFDDGGFTAIALSDPGELTAAERAALLEVPADQAELNISTSADCCPDLTGMVILVLMTLVLAEATAPIKNISADKLERLSAGATARELMEIRREALGHHH